MNVILGLVVHTANLLGSFNDPFEFAGDYGSSINPIREKVFEQVVSKETYAKNMGQSQEVIQKATELDKEHGPLLCEVATPEFLNLLKERQKELGFSDKDFEKINSFINTYGKIKAFYFLRNSPEVFLKLDKAFRDQAARVGKSVEFPILSSTTPILGSNLFEWKKALFVSLFTKDSLLLTERQESIQISLKKLPSTFFRINSKYEDLDAFTSPVGQVFFYWLYQSLNLHLVQDYIEEINQVKTDFAKGLGNPNVRAEAFRNKLIDADTAVLFTQEADQIVSYTLTKDGLFHQIDKQNPADGTLVFLKGNAWEPDYQVIALENYEGFFKGKINLILAKNKLFDRYFLLASAHGNSSNAEDGRKQLQIIKEKYDVLKTFPEFKELQLVIGTDENTKNEKEVHAYMLI